MVAMCRFPYMGAVGRQAGWKGSGDMREPSMYRCQGERVWMLSFPGIPEVENFPAAFTPTAIPIANPCEVDVEAAVRMVPARQTSEGPHANGGGLVE